MKHLRLLSLGLLLFIFSCSDENDPSDPSSPNSDDRSRFAGSWICAESGGQTFSISISLHGVEDSIYIDNFSNYGPTADALGLVNGNSLTIPGQNISVTSVFVQGSGVLNSAGTKITMNYVADGDTISASCTKN